MEIVILRSCLVLVERVTNNVVGGSIARTKIGTGETRQEVCCNFNGKILFNLGQ